VHPMNNEPLAPIFLDNKPIALKDPKPKVSAVLSAGGHAGATEVKWLQTQAGTQGIFLRPDHTLDRTSEPTKAIYLTSLVRGPASPLPQATNPGIVDEDVVARPFAGARPDPVTKQTPWPTREASAFPEAESADDTESADDQAEGEEPRSGE